MLDAKDIDVELGGKAILRGASLQAQAGRLTVIVGPNGSGKTTLLRAITGDLPHSGSVCLNGQNTRRIPAWALAEYRAVLPQASQLAFPFTVHEVVRLGLVGATALRADATHLPTRALERVGLAGYGGRYFQELSGGEQARAQLARVLLQVWQPVVAGVPRWLFLDEPVAALDIGHQLQVMTMARDFARAGGGVVAVMHDLNLTAMFADDITLMLDGQVLAHGGVRDVMTDTNLSHAYGCALRVSSLPRAGEAFILPQAAEIA
ncbi:heme ABC transporter ATP-binding protein [Roseinatronobacter alkalisoli]|uniref:Heme ABC transporter ATP-binding protein n=1 Tax=Roseinatronobacter alkalisoli TaxID=3028235 RepID=A0ABT5T458_9RHOB|nr:heme ABC transporter ATP-binding protein [Roseinatronobacter sp. HJB301]MDD7969834.1 heme ABC transporter ATP-binding protein [Roseinatronobacter sp. HJB301]